MFMLMLTVLGFFQDLDSTTGAKSSNSLYSAFTDHWVAVIMIIVLVVFVVMVLRSISNIYIKVPPNEAAVIYGAGSTSFVSGGAAFVIPFIRNTYSMDLTVRQVEVSLGKVPNKDKIPVNVEAVATYKISSKELLLPKAAENFGDAFRSGKLSDVNDTMETKVKHILESHLRSAISTLDLDTLLSKRDEFNSSIQRDSEPELEELGMELKSFNILHVGDDNMIIDALGKKASATVLADSNIEQAKQKQRETIETTNANREAQTTAAVNAAAIAEAEKERDRRKADYQAEISRASAIAAQAEPLATAEARKAVVQAEVEVESKRAESETDLQKKIAERNKEEFNATIITKAEATKEETIIQAEGQALARTRKAEAEKQALESEGAGEASKSQAIGLAAAEVTRRTGLASAEVTKETALAIAAGKEAELLASAKGTEAELLAQATGRKAMIDAQGSMDDNQRELYMKIQMLDRMPTIIEALGDAGDKIMKQVADATTAHLSQIKEIRVYDSPGSGGEGALARTVQMGPDVLFGIVNNLKKTGMLEKVLDMAKGFGFDLSDAVKTVEEIQANAQAIDMKPGAKGDNTPPKKP